MSTTAEITIRLAQFVLVAIGTYLLCCGEAAEKLRRQAKELDAMNARMDAIEADCVARQQKVPDLDEAVLDMATRLDEELEASSWDEDTRRAICRLSEDAWELYTVLMDAFIS